MLAAASSFWLHDLWHPLTGRGYQFWSGIAGELGILGAALTIVRAHNCHVPWCLRIARHPVEGSPYRVCRKHHPSVPDELTVSDVQAAHRPPVE